MPVPEAHRPYTEVDYFPTWDHIGLRHADTDDQGHVNHCSMVNILETARDIYIRNNWPNDAGRPSIVIVGLDLQFHKELAYPNDVRIGTRLDRVGNSSLVFGQAIFAAGSCIASSRATCVLVDGETRRPLRVPDPWRALQASGS